MKYFTWFKYIGMASLCVCLPLKADEGQISNITLIGDPASRRVEECKRALPALIPEASLDQIVRACKDKYALDGLYVNGCLARVRKTHETDGAKTVLESESDIRAKCSAREPIASISVQPYSSIQATRETESPSVVINWPAIGPVSYVTVGPILFKKKLRNEIVISGKSGDPVFAAAEGKVVNVSLDTRTGTLLLLVNHQEQFLSIYGHLKNANVVVGQTVNVGEKIGEMGSSFSGLVRGLSGYMSFSLSSMGKDSSGAPLASELDVLELLPQRD